MYSRGLIRSFQNSCRFFSERVVIPRARVHYKKRNYEKTEFSSQLISHLEKLSLVRFTDEAAVINLRDAVSRANRLLDVDVEGVSEMEFVWENKKCELHDDNEQNLLTADRALANAAKKVEDFFVTPPGNVPLEESEVKLDIKAINK